MKLVEHEFYTMRDGRVKEIKLIELAPLVWEAWGKLDGKWHCNSPHKLTEQQVEEIR